MIIFKYVCIQIVRFLPLPLVILTTLQGLAALQAELFGRGGSAADELLSQDVGILAVYLIIFFGLKPWAKKYSPPSAKRGGGGV
jgi:hypothetical protein